MSTEPPVLTGDNALAADFGPLVDLAFSSGLTRDDVREALETAMLPREPELQYTLVAIDPGTEEAQVFQRLGDSETSPWFNPSNGHRYSWREVCRHGIPTELAPRVHPQPDLVDGQGDQWFWISTYTSNPKPFARADIERQYGIRAEVPRDGQLF